MERETLCDDGSVSGFLPDSDSPHSGLQSGLLLIALVLVIISAFVRVESGTWENGLAVLFYFGVFSVAGYLMGARRRWLVAYGVLAGMALMVGLVTASLSHPHPVLEFSRYFLGLLLQILLVCLVFRFSLFQHTASLLDRILAGISGYLILGLMWANLYSLNEVLQPGGLVESSGAAVDGGGGGFLYFSLVTLSTTGYGDILARTTSTRLLACLQALTGTLYLAVFISAVVGGGSDRKTVRKP